MTRGLGLTFLVACKAATAPPATVEPLRVETARLARHDVARKLVIVATLEPWQRTVLYAKVPGYVSELRVDRGSRLEKGELIAVVDIAETRAEVPRALAVTKQFEAAIEQQRAAERLADATAKRMQTIRSEEPGAVSQQNLDEANSKAETTRLAVAVSEGKLAVARAELDRQHTLVGYARITAPFDGVISERDVDLGALVGAGSVGRPMPIVTIADDHRLRVIIDVPEVEVPYVTVGHAADLTIDAFPGTTFHATVGRRADVVDTATRTMRVELETDNTDHKLSAGMFARVKLDLETHPNALTVDPRWLRFQKDQPYVMIAKDGIARRVNLKTGADDGKAVEVVDGLKGDEVIITTAGTINDGASIVLGAT